MTLSYEWLHFIDAMVSSFIESAVVGVVDWIIHLKYDHRLAVEWFGEFADIFIKSSNDCAF